MKALTPNDLVDRAVKAFAKRMARPHIGIARRHTVGGRVVV